MIISKVSKPVMIIRVRSIAGLEYMKPNSVLVGLNIADSVWETTTQNMGTVRVKFVDESGLETREYWIRTVPQKRGAL